MPQSEPITILLVNEHAEEIKLVTISLRGFFADVRIEVAYSAEEAERMIQAPADSWAVTSSTRAPCPIRLRPSSLISNIGCPTPLSSYKPPEPIPRRRSMRFTWVQTFPLQTLSGVSD